MDSRVELLTNFIIHFSNSPLFGNIIVDRLTTGEGTYIHSFMGTIFTHLGLLGASIFIIYLYLSIKELCRIEILSFEDNAIKIYYILIFIFIIACIGVFLLGLLYGFY